ncbi:MAG: hypothetical protein BGO89_07095 [Candidatus Kapaibacterium thiocyanatum]|uniref:Uncharacterized protein n=1 Tax=Candidatus Kapaibacterium thiocyanatum TaxID=1895771 RepID=A0A1M3KZC3_9BACT|nr:MAG: hypothetical protein BGO89_07095 ['Candidatus Kapabacteria' thiocyanatum]
MITSLPLPGQGGFDTSRAEKLKRVWSMTVKGMSPYDVSYLQDLGGQRGFHVLAARFRLGRENVLWSTQPRVDTTSLFNWPGTEDATRIYEVDYDDVPPHEYVTSDGMVWQCPSADRPLPLTPIDTLKRDSCINTPSFSADLDGDGHLDLITIDTDASGNSMARIVVGGFLGKGCMRVVTIDKPGYRRQRHLKAFFRSATGTWRIVQHEKNPYDLTSWLIIYDMEFYRHSGYMFARAVKRDSLHGSWTSLNEFGPFYTSVCVSDTVARKDWFIVQRRPDYTNPTYVFIERFDITDGRFLSVEQVGTYGLVLSETHFSSGLGMGRPVIMLNEYFCYADNINQPFARWSVAAPQDPTYGGSTTTLTAINDQTGDDRPDILATTSAWSKEYGGYANTVIALYTLDPAVSVEESPLPPGAASSVRIVGDGLELSLTAPAMVSAHIVGMDGREVALFTPTQYPDGTGRVNLAPYLRMHPRGVYVVRVRIGDTLHTVKLIL